MRLEGNSFWVGLLTISMLASSCGQITSLRKNPTQPKDESPEEQIVYDLLYDQLKDEVRNLTPEQRLDAVEEIAELEADLVELGDAIDESHYAIAEEYAAVVGRTAEAGAGVYVLVKFARLSRAIFSWEVRKIARIENNALKAAARASLEARYAHFAKPEINAMFEKARHKVTVRSPSVLSDKFARLGWVQKFSGPTEKLRMTTLPAKGANEVARKTFEKAMAKSSTKFKIKSVKAVAITALGVVIVGSIAVMIDGSYRVGLNIKETKKFLDSLANLRRKQREARESLILVKELIGEVAEEEGETETAEMVAQMPSEPLE